MMALFFRKVETILRRGQFNTRPRDFYDVFMLDKTLEYSPSLFVKALKATATHRNTLHIFDNIFLRINEIQNSPILKERWAKYSTEYKYAEQIIYEKIMETIKKLTKDFMSI